MLTENVIIIASGPSLTVDDVNLCSESGMSIVAVNSSWKLISACDVIYAGDHEWWLNNITTINSTAERWTCSQSAAIQFDLNYHKSDLGLYNSGMKAIEFAASYGGKNILLTGFDCSLKHGIHWHGQHTNTPNPTIFRVSLWHQQFRNLADNLSSEINVVNCSRYTELKCFQRNELFDEIRKFSSLAIAESPHHD